MERRNAASSRRVARAIGWAAAAIGGILAGYLVAGTLGGTIPVHRGWRAPPRGITIFVETNGIHTGLVLPKRAAGVDWTRLARPEHLADPRYAAYGWLSFGWGDRAFYLETPRWSDVRPATVLAAAIGSRRTLLHVDHLPRPVPATDVRPLVLTPDQYRRLSAFIAATARPGGGHAHGYAGYDAFYEAQGRYSAIRTCNAWTGEALAAAGVRVGAWTPFAWSVMAWF